MNMQYTDELTPENFAELAQSPFAEKKLTTMSEEVRALIDEQEDYARNHPVTAIYRIAVAGCLTRLGGTAKEFSSDPNEGYKIHLENGEWASVLTVGSIITYADGSTARIVSGAGFLYESEGKGVALVGSMLDNGDEVISTPQSGSMLTVREGIPLLDDFLVVPGV
ncbi:hypothetical protein [Citrobacter amalonaticus]|uniref:hypothetical protein n=1 Tax=Citrobacter amalonaticus TaxID=35703 RepID=UPI0015E1920B|nr:hypothetical protein [Citrobacter amalonaticus]